MTSIRRSFGATRTAALMRLAAFLIAAGSLIVIPYALAAAAVGHVSAGSALAATGAAMALTGLAALVARTLDPLRA